MKRPVRIMVVEDNPADVLLLKETLRQLDVSFSLEHYVNGEDAAKAIAGITDCPDLILLDINIPRVDGLELLSLVRRHETTARATVGIFTSSRAASDQREAERLGADGYIVKPVGYYEFLSGVGSAIQRLLEGKKIEPDEGPGAGCWRRRCSRRALRRRATAGAAGCRGRRLRDTVPPHKIGDGASLFPKGTSVRLK